MRLGLKSRPNPRQIQNLSHDPTMLTVSTMRIPSDFELGLACATLIGCRGCTGAIITRRGLPWTHWRGRVVMIVFKEEILRFDVPPHSIHIWTFFPLLITFYLYTYT